MELRISGKPLSFVPWRIYLTNHFQLKLIYLDSVTLILCQSSVLTVQPLRTLFIQYIRFLISNYDIIVVDTAGDVFLTILASFFARW